MENEGDYQVIITHEGMLVFIIKTRETAPEKPFILYDGGKHATLYRREDETVLLDYLNDKVIPYLDASEKAVVFELSDEIEDVVCDYEVPIKHIKNNTFAQNAGSDL